MSWALRTFQSDLVPCQRCDRLSEKLFRVLVTRGDTRHVHLLPFYWDIVGPEDGLNGLGYFGSDAITFFSQHDGVSRSMKAPQALNGSIVPGMSDTVYRPPNFVGLKMSDCTVAIATSSSAKSSHILQHQFLPLAAC